MTGKTRGMEGEEGSAVSDDRVLVQRQALRYCRMYNDREGEGMEGEEGSAVSDDRVLVQRQALR